MPEYVRVRDRSTGHKFTAIKSAAEAESGLQVLNDPAVNENGEPLAPEYAEPTKASKPVKPPKPPKPPRAARARTPRKTAAAKKAVAPVEPTTDGQSADTTEGEGR